MLIWIAEINSTQNLSINCSPYVIKDTSLLLVEFPIKRPQDTQVLQNNAYQIYKSTVQSSMTGEIQFWNSPFILP